MKKRILSWVTAIAMLISMSILPAMAADEGSFADIGGHWGAEVIEKWMGHGLVNGYSDGTFRPDGFITRGELAAVLARLMRYQTAADNTYGDLEAGAWYEAPLLQATRAGIIRGDGQNVRPKAEITREEVAVIFARILNLGAAEEAPAFTDAADIAVWATDAVGAMAAEGYMQGNDGKVRPKDNIRRAEVMQLIDNVFAKLYDAEGVYSEDVTGNVIVSVPGVELKDMTIGGDLLVAQGVGEGDLTLNNVRLAGNLIVRGGGVNSIIVTGGSTVGTVTVERIDGKVRVFVDGAEVECVYVDDGSDEVIIEGSVDTVVITSPGLTVSIAGDVNNVVIEQSAAGATLDVAAGSTVGKVESAADGVTIEGDGKVTAVEVTAGEGVSVQTEGTTVTVSEDAGAVDAGGETLDPGEEGKTDGGTTTPSIPAPPSKRTVTAALTDDDNGDAAVASPVTVANTGDTLNYTLTLGNLLEGKDVEYTITEDDADGILTLTEATTGTLTGAANTTPLTFTVAANAAGQPAKTATVTISFTLDTGTYASLASIVVEFVLEDNIPTIEGNVSVTGAYSSVFGDTLTVVTSGITTPNPGGYSYAWYRAATYNYNPEVDTLLGTEASYTVVAADVGCDIYVDVTSANTKGSVRGYAGAISKAPGAAVDATPAVSGEPTHNKITVGAVEITTNPGGQTAEYAISTGNSEAPDAGWQASTTFTSLEAGTTYYVWARAAENATNLAGVAAVSAGIATTDGSGLPALEGTVSISAGEPATIGAQLTADVTSVTGGTDRTITWYRSEDNTHAAGDGDVAVATGATYTPVPADYDYYLVVVVSSNDAVGVVSVATAAAVVKIAGADVDSDPVAVEVTYNSITVNPVTITTNPGNQEVEYARGNASDATGVWEIGHLTFSSLTPETSYYIWARAAETDTYAAGTARRSAEIVTAAAQSIPLTLTVYKDDVLWDDNELSIDIEYGGMITDYTYEAMTAEGATFTASAPEGEYISIFVDGVPLYYDYFNTGAFDEVIDEVTLYFYTVEFEAVTSGTGAESEITATAYDEFTWEDISISNGDAVLSGTEVTFTVDPVDETDTITWGGGATGNEETAVVVYNQVTAKVTCELTAAAPTAVVLASDSAGTAGDAEITALTVGAYYKVLVGASSPAVYYVDGDGELTADFSDLAAMGEAGKITGLTNGETYQVIAASAYEGALYYNTSVGSGYDEKQTATVDSNGTTTINVAANKWVELSLDGLFAEPARLGAVETSKFRFANFNGSSMTVFYAWNARSDNAGIVIWERYGDSETTQEVDYNSDDSALFGIYYSPSNAGGMVYQLNMGNTTKSRTFVFDCDNGDFIFLSVSQTVGT